MVDITVHVNLSRSERIAFEGRCIVRVAALNHDGNVRRQFSVYSNKSEYVAERIDDPGTIDVRFWGAKCAALTDVYDFFGNEPLANYLYGRLGLEVPGLRNVNVV